MAGWGCGGVRLRPVRFWRAEELPAAGLAGAAAHPDCRLRRLCSGQELLPAPTTLAVDCVAIGAAALGPLLRAIDAAQADTGQRLAPETVQIAVHIKQRESN